jgi:UDP-GlcNAc3NAcA epimerase
MKSLLTIIGARPQIIKAAALSRAIRNQFDDRIREILVHTGQHYDTNMSEVFFQELGIPRPVYNMGVGSGSHGKQTADMISLTEQVLLEEKPDFVVLYGDTNSTLAGSVAASKLHIPVVHVEAGLRSFNKSMPEEINRIVCDHTSTLLFSPTRAAINNLIREGFNPHAAPPYTPDNPGIFHCGDIMYDNSLYFSETAEIKSSILSDYGLKKNNFILGTIHRDNNTDDPDRLTSIFSALNTIAADHKIAIVMPLHPRTSKLLEQNIENSLYKRIRTNRFIRIIPPTSFFDIIALEKNCRMVMTDSGGLQKEAYFFQKPVIILRPETEWVEIVENGAGIITDADKERIINAFNYFIGNPALDFSPVFGDGRAAEFICSKILHA